MKSLSSNPFYVCDYDAKFEAAFNALRDALIGADLDFGDLSIGPLMRTKDLVPGDVRRTTFRSLREAPFVVADVTPRRIGGSRRKHEWAWNPNVMCEVAVARDWRIPVYAFRQDNVTGEPPADFGDLWVHPFEPVTPNSNAAERLCSSMIAWLKNQDSNIRVGAMLQKSIQPLREALERARHWDIGEIGNFTVAISAAERFRSIVTEIEATGKLDLAAGARQITGKLFSRSLGWLGSKDRYLTCSTFRFWQVFGEKHDFLDENLKALKRGVLIRRLFITNQPVSRLSPEESKILQQHTALTRRFPNYECKYRELPRTDKHYAKPWLSEDHVGIFQFQTPSKRSFLLAPTYTDGPDPLELRHISISTDCLADAHRFDDHWNSSPPMHEDDGGGDDGDSDGREDQGNA